jgi:hypothetical protein
VLFIDHEKGQIERLVSAVTKASYEDLPAVFAQLYPHEWRRAGMLPGLRPLIADWLREAAPRPGRPT